MALDCKMKLRQVHLRLLMPNIIFTFVDAVGGKPILDCRYFNRKIPKKYSILITEKELFVNWDMFRMLQVVILKKCIG